MRAELGNQRHAGGRAAYQHLTNTLRAEMGTPAYQTAWERGEQLETEILLDAVQDGKLDALTRPFDCVPGAG